MSAKRSLNGRITLMLFVATLAYVMFAPSTQASFTVDSSFGSRGLVTGDVGPIEFSATISPKVLTVDMEGRVLFGAASGGVWQVTRFLPNGELDTSFGENGEVIIDRWAGYGSPSPGANLGSGLVRPNGRILLVGYLGSTVSGNNARRGDASMVVTQLMSDGSPDLSFGLRDGSNLIGAGKGAVKAVIQSDGSFLVGAFKQIRSSGRTDDGALFKFTERGRIDRSFGPGNNLSAVNILGAPGRPSNVFDVDLLPGGKILMSGTSKNRLWLMRLKKNGTRDRSFGNAGQVIMIPGGKRKTRSAVARDVEVDRKGRILLAGFAVPKDYEIDPGYGLVMRIRSGGELDRSFGKNGTVRLYGTPAVGEKATRLYDIQFDSEGRIWVAGSAGRTARNERRAVAVRLFADGTKDTRFFRNGVLKIQIGDGSVGTSLSRRGNKIYFSGRYDQGSQERFFLKRLGPLS